MKTKLTKLILTLLFVLAAAALTGCGGKAEGENGKKVIKIETNGRPAPFIETVENKEDALYTTKDGVYLTGYDIAVLVELFKLPEFADYELDLSVSSNSLVDTQQGVIDATINNWSYNKERAETFLFSFPYTKSRYTITSAAGTTISSFEELAESGLIIYGGAGGNTTNAIERWNDARKDGEKKINLEYTSVDFTVQLQEAIEGKVALIHDQPVILKYKQAYPEQFKSLNITVLSDQETATNITANNTSHILFGKTGTHSKEYQKLISEGIKKLYENGTLAELGKKWIAEKLGDDSVSVLPLESDLIYLN
ncbi:MAG: transporter substrate-binding domain-containing protein [Lachnospiraceae bacterium]|nr:transporter substrate-binding domain-containing protein [Lachnospiraceae bacterium]